MAGSTDYIEFNIYIDGNQIGSNLSTNRFSQFSIDIGTTSVSIKNGNANSPTWNYSGSGTFLGLSATQGATTPDSDCEVGDTKIVNVTTSNQAFYFYSVESLASSNPSIYKLQQKTGDSTVADLVLSADSVEHDTVVTSDSSKLITSGAVATSLDTKLDKANPTGTGSFSLNRKANTTVGNYSFAEGYNTTASGAYSHAEGNITTASGDYSHAEGSSTKASGVYSHAEGWSTTASGEQSHAEGNSTKASGRYSHAEGWSTTAQRKSQHVFGEYNILDTSGSTSTRGAYVEIVGNGTSNAKSNARTLDWNGNEVLAGGLTIGANATISDGTNSISVANIASKSEVASKQDALTITKQTITGVSAQDWGSFTLTAGTYIVNAVATDNGMGDVKPFAITTTQADSTLMSSIIGPCGKNTNQDNGESKQVCGILSPTTTTTYYISGYNGYFSYAPTSTELTIVKLA